MTNQERLKQAFRRRLRSGMYELEEDGTTIYLVPIEESANIWSAIFPGQQS